MKHGDKVLIEVTIEADYGSRSPKERFVASFGPSRDKIHFNESDVYDIETHPLVMALKNEVEVLRKALET